MFVKIVAVVAVICGIYTQSGTVVDVNRPDDIVLVETEDGNLCEFYGTEDWMEGDRIELTMHDNGTAMPEDDVIIRTIYKG